MNKEEILAWIIPSNEEIASDEVYAYMMDNTQIFSKKMFQVDHLFSGADDDMNEILSFEEVLNNHDLFVGSEATDYGDHLHNLDRFDDEL